jgi:hypothetical protein
MLYVAMRAMQPPGSFLPGPDSRSGVVTFRWIGREDAPVDDIVRAADDLVAAIAASPPEPEEVERTQRFLRETTGRDAGFLLPDFPEAAAMRIAACAISGIDTDRACAQLAAMTKDDVARVAAKWLAPGRRVVVAARGVKPEREERVDTPYEKALAKARQVRNERQAASDLASGLLPEVRVALTWDEAAQTMRRTIGGVEYADDEALKQAIRNAHDALVKRGKRDAPVTLDGDVRIPWAEVIKVVNLVKALGIDKLEFAMGAPPKPKDEPK